MSVQVTVERSFGPLDELPLTTAEDMREIGLLVRERIVTRTRQGIGADGQPFQPYSAAYALQKEHSLGSVFRAHGGYGTVDLTVSGAMLNQLQIVAVTENSVTLGWV